MKIERAVEILNPANRERYDDLEEVNEACRMGMKALKKQIRRPPETIFSGGRVKLCPSCQRGENLHNRDGERNNFCGFCGQALDWSGVE